MKDKIDLLIRQGNLAPARRLLDQIHPNELPVLDFARFYRRLGLFSKGLQILRPLLFLNEEVRKDAPREVLIEYAAHLSQLGLTREAKLHLAPLFGGTSYEQELANAFIHIKEWNFSAAKKHLFQALSASHNDYEEKVANSNILNCLLGEFNFKEAISFGEALINSLDSEKNRLLLGWAELGVAQAHFHLHAEKSFDHYLQRSLKHLDLDTLAVTQWITLGECAFRPTPRALRKLAALHDHAIQLGDWETLRDLTLYHFHLNRDSKTLEKLWWGSSTDFHQKRIEFWLKKTIEPKQLIWNAKEMTGITLQTKVTKKKPKTLNLDDAPHAFKLGQIPHRLLLAVTSDWFKPQTVPELFNHLFPERHYHPVHSPDLVYQAVRRLNAHFKQKQISLELISKQHRYFLHATGSTLFKKEIQLEPENHDPFLIQWRRLIGEQSVSTEELAYHFEKTVRWVQLQINTHTPEIKKTRKGRRIFYQLDSTGV